MMISRVTLTLEVQCTDGTTFKSPISVSPYLYDVVDSEILAELGAEPEKSTPDEKLFAILVNKIRRNEGFVVYEAPTENRDIIDWLSTHILSMLRLKSKDK
jgi:hypothetical protein